MDAQTRHLIESSLKKQFIDECGNQISFLYLHNEDCHYAFRIPIFPKIRIIKLFADETGALVVVRLATNEKELSVEDLKEVRKLISYSQNNQSDYGIKIDEMGFIEWYLYYTDTNDDYIDLIFKIYIPRICRRLTEKFDKSF